MEFGIGLVVEHVLAKDETGVRFSLAAQIRLRERTASLLREKRKIFPYEQGEMEKYLAM